MALRADDRAFRKVSAESTLFKSHTRQKEIPEKSRPFDWAVVFRLKDSRKDSIPFQSSPYVCIKDNNWHTGAEADRVGSAVRGCFSLIDAGGFSLNAWYSAARTVTRIPHAPEVIHVCG